MYNEATLQKREGSSQCVRPCCQTCLHIKTGLKFTSTVTSEQFHIRVTATCKINIVYLVECQKCKKQYVGETENAVHLSLNDHRSDYYQQLADKHACGSTF